MTGKYYQSKHNIERVGEQFIHIHESIMMDQSFRMLKMKNEPLIDLYFKLLFNVSMPYPLKLQNQDYYKHITFNIATL